MANQRKTESPRDSRLATALQFANLGLEQQNQADHQHAQRVASALHMLGLMNQQEQERARQQEAANLLGFHQQQDQATQAHAMEALGIQRQGQQDEAHHRNVLEQQGADNGAMQFVAHLLGTQMPIDNALGFLPASQQPNVNRLRAGALQGRIGQATAAVAPIYQANQHNPAKVAEALKLVEPAYLGQPEVWNGIPWDQLNQSLQGAQPIQVPTAPPPGVPDDITNRIAQQQQGQAIIQAKLRAEAEARQKQELVDQYIRQQLPSSGQLQPSLRLGY